MANPLDRTWYNTLVDDDGSGTTGTVWNKSQVNAFMNAIDVALTGVVDKTGTPAAGSVAVFNDADTLKAEPGFIYSAATLRLPATGAIQIRNTANSADLPVAAVAANDLMWLGPGAGSPGLYLPGGRLTFPTTQVPSADANTVDDYREQTIAPTLIGAGGGTNTYAINTAVVTKFGRGVLVSGRVALSAKGMSGAVTLRGLPFTVGAIWAPVVLFIPYFYGFAASVQSLGGYANPSTTDVLLVKNGSGNAVFLDSADLTATSEFVFGALYTTT